MSASPTSTHASPRGIRSSMQSSHRHSLTGSIHSLTDPSASLEPSSRPNRVQYGFNPPTTNGITIVSAPQSAPAPLSEPIVMQKTAIPLSAKDLSPQMQGYRSQIPGWSAADDQKFSQSLMISQSSIGNAGGRGSVASGSSYQEQLTQLIKNSFYKRDRKMSMVEVSSSNRQSSSTNVSAPATPTDTNNSSMNGPANNGEEKQKTKAELKAIRKAERALLVAAKNGPLLSSAAPNSASTQQSSSPSKSHNEHFRPHEPQQQQQKNEHKRSASQSKPSSAAPAKVTSKATTKKQREMPLFSHLTPSLKNRKAIDSLKNDMRTKDEIVHPSVRRLGLQLQHHTIIGSNNRCIAMLQAFRDVIRDYKTPPNTFMSRHLDSFLKPQINYLVSCRPLAVSMGNAIRYLKMEISTISSDTPEDDAKAQLDERIRNFVRDRIVYADSAIVQLGTQKIRDGDVILTFGNSTVIRKILLSAKTDGKVSFRVIVADSRPLMEGKQLLASLVAAGVECDYLHLNALSYVMKDVSKVFLGAHALLANGVLMSRAGTAIVALMAHSMGVPVIACCETYKFSDRVQLDSFVYNELGDPDELEDIGRYPTMQESVLKVGQLSGAVSGTLKKKADSVSSISEHIPAQPGSNPLQNWRDIPDLKILNLMYDVTPAEFVSLVITEVGLIPCSSVPVVIRESNKAGTWLSSTGF